MGLLKVVTIFKQLLQVSGIGKIVKTKQEERRKVDWVKEMSRESERIKIKYSRHKKVDFPWNPFVI